MRNTPQRKAKLSFLYKHVVTIGLTVQASSCFKLWRSNQRGKRECGTKGKGAAPTNKNVPTEWKVSLSIISPEVKTFSFSILCLMNDFCLLFEKWLLFMSYIALFFSYNGTVLFGGLPHTAAYMITGTSTCPFFVNYPNIYVIFYYCLRLLASSL